jgi:CRISPR-associated Csx2 family protein
MKSSLVFTLGKGVRQKDSSRYRTATYQFADGHISSESPFFGFSLLSWLRGQRAVHPDVIIVLGTKGSIWDALLESAPESLDEEVLAISADLAPKVERNAVSEPDLDALSLWLEKVYQAPFKLRVVPEGLDHTGQMQTLQTLAEAVPPRSELHMCVTHGLRHMPMLQMLSAFHLAETQEVKLAGLYYGALELGQNGKNCPVIELTGAADLQKWSLALHSVTTTGRLSSLAEATRDECPRLADVLDETDFRLQANQTGRAAISGRAASQIIVEKGLPGSGGLYTQAAIARLTWASQGSLWQKQHLGARQALEAGDFLRCAILCLEGFISKKLPPTVDERDYGLREEAYLQLLAALPFRSEERLDMKTLEYLRNAIAHGSSTTRDETRALLEDRGKMKSFLEKMLRRLAQP